MTKYTFKSHFATDFEYIKPQNNRQTVIYLHGFCSNAWGQKPEAVKSICMEQGLGFVRFDFAGHGSDADRFAEADFSVWQNQVFEIIEDVVKGDIVMIGSSMGGWISMLAAIRYPQRIKALIGLAAAPNFVKRFNALITDEQKRQLEQSGSFMIVNNDFAYTITSRFVETAFNGCLPENGEKWAIKCPVYLLQGMKDASVPWREVLKYAENIESDNVVVKLLKNSNHRLNDDEAVAELRSTIINVCM